MHKKNVKIYQNCQNLRNNYCFTSALRQCEGKKINLCFIVFRFMYKFKQKNERDYQLPFYRFLFLSQTKRKKRKNRNQLPFCHFSFILQSKTHKRKSKNRLPFCRFLFFPKVKQINEKTKIDFRFIVFRFFPK